MAHDVLRHRVVLSYEALSDGVTSDMVIKRVMDNIPIPAEPLKEHLEMQVAKAR